MGNIVDYVKKNCNKSFSEKSLSKEDALVLCQFAYLKFDGVLSAMDETPVSIKDLSHHEKVDLLFSDYRYEKDNRALFEGMAGSVRFSDVKVSFYINKIETENELQFSAITYVLPNSEVFVAFRGTDENIVGWQEDFGLALNKPIAGQKMSTKYINDVSRKFKGNFYVGGHSKGGNLAMYAAMNCPTDIQSRISKVFSFDGPGFRPEFLEEYNYSAIRKKVVSVIPQSSLVGMLLAADGDSTVVMSKSLGVWQHNPYTWVIKGDKFANAVLKEPHKFLIMSLNEWILSLDEEQLNRVVKLFIEILAATQAQTTMELSKEAFKCAGNVIRKTKDIDDDTKRFLYNTAKSYFDMVKDMAKADMKEHKENKGRIGNKERTENRERRKIQTNE